jgi:hypothetical protein
MTTADKHTVQRFKALYDLAKYNWTTFKFTFRFIPKEPNVRINNQIYDIQSAEYLNKNQEWIKMKYNPKIFIPKKFHGLDKYESFEYNYYYSMKLIYDTKFDKIYTFEEYEEERNNRNNFSLERLEEYMAEQAMLKIEIEQRKREQELKRKAKEEQERMEELEREQKRRDYFVTLREEMMKFNDNENVNITIKEITWFNKYGTRLPIDAYHVILNYCYADDDCIHFEDETLNIDFSIEALQYLRWRLHNIFQETKNKLRDKIEIRKTRNQLEVKLFEKVKDPDDVCGICGSNYENDAYKLKACNHIYHKDCLIEWFVNGGERKCIICTKSVIEE